MNSYSIEDAKRDFALVEQTWGARDSDGTTAPDRLLAFIEQQAAEIERLEQENASHKVCEQARGEAIQMMLADRDHAQAVARVLADLWVQDADPYEWAELVSKERTHDETVDEVLTWAEQQVKP